MPFWSALLALALSGGQAVERQPILTITAADIDNGVLSEITWDHGALLLQGVIANPDGSLSGRYVIVPGPGTELRKLTAQTSASAEYWEKKATRRSPSGLGTISTGT